MAKRYYSTKKEWNDAVETGKVTPMSAQLKRLKEKFLFVQNEIDRYEKEQTRKHLRDYDKTTVKYYIKLIKKREKRIEKGYL